MLLSYKNGTNIWIFNFMLIVDLFLNDVIARRLRTAEGSKALKTGKSREISKFNGFLGTKPKLNVDFGVWDYF